ncbi:hypothetical protein ACQ33O_11560 [Ferruginibacter sp. SUN002]|uniref:hypothetical protein n=1 Tax=Ferruginibacter sp. SUN002 TaxID=2937789 RepID=UPI003D35C3F8
MGQYSEKIVFLEVKDELSKLIDSKANELYHLLKKFDASSLQTTDFFKHYFTDHHLGQRLIFSIQNSAHILYHAIKKSNKHVSELNIVDYGAGLGTLFMLGSMLQIKRFVYNDHLAEWKNNAALICTALNIPVTDYIVGDITDVIKYAETENFSFDIIVSRNVVEHIYSLPDFYAAVYEHNNGAIVYSTTTANYHNLATRLQHILIHRKIENKHYSVNRKKAIQKINPSFSEKQLMALVSLTRGKALSDFTEAVDDFSKNKTVTKVPYLKTNTCDHETGVWVEHLLSKEAYREIINHAGFSMEYSAGFWDTNYKNSFVNLCTKSLNKLIKILGNKGYLLSPFINVVAGK